MRTCNSQQKQSGVEKLIALLRVASSPRQLHALVDQGAAFMRYNDTSLGVDGLPVCEPLFLTQLSGSGGKRPFLVNAFGMNGKRT
jgi:hypothetical protein